MKNHWYAIIVLALSPLVALSDNAAKSEALLDQSPGKRGGESIEVSPLPHPQQGNAKVRGEIQEEQEIDIREVEKQENLLNTNGKKTEDSQRRYD